MVGGRNCDDYATLRGTQLPVLLEPLVINLENEMNIPWESMETAPTDGTEFLARTKNGRITIAWFDPLIDAFISQLDVYGSNPELMMWSGVSQQKQETPFCFQSGNHYPISDGNGGTWCEACGMKM